MLSPPLSCKLPQVKEKKCPLIFQDTSQTHDYHCCSQKYEVWGLAPALLSLSHAVILKGSVYFLVRHKWNIPHNEKLNVSHKGTNMSTFISIARADWPADARHINSCCNKRNAKERGTFLCVSTELLPCRERVHCWWCSVFISEDPLDLMQISGPLKNSAGALHRHVYCFRSLMNLLVFVCRG